MTIALIYHEVVPVSERDRNGFPGAAAARYKLSPEQFERHLDAIQRANVPVGLVWDRPQLALTFDDGGASAPVAAAALERRGWRGHFFVTSGRIGTPGFVDADGVRDLAQRGHDVGSHSVSHPTYMGALGAEALAEEWRRSREQLAEVLGSPPRSAAVPGGFLSEAVMDEAAAAGYTLLMTSQPTARRAQRGQMEVHGRFTVWAATTPERISAYARRDRRALLEMWLAWQAKTLPKRLSPALYERVRQRWAAHRRHE